MNAHAIAETDVEKQVMAGKPVGHVGPWRIQIGDSELRFRSVSVADPICTGAQILTASGVREPSEYLVLQMLSNGLLEAIHPEETVDIREGSAARFLVFRSDRTFRMLIDDRAYDWAAERISGATIRAVANVEDRTLAVWQEMRDRADEVVADDEFVNLADPNVERFALRACAFDIVVNAVQERVTSPRLRYWELVRLAFPQSSPSENIVYTIDYAFGPHQNPEGALGEHESVKLKDGMKFYVTPTDKS